MRSLYSALIQVLRPFALAAVLWRGLRNRLYWSGLGERFGFGTPPRPGHSIWVHAVSLGEVTAATPLVRALLERHPGMPLVLTTATPTGRARAQSLFGGAVEVRYLPYDTPGSMRRFIERARPAVAMIMETELWPNLFDQCRRRGIPLILANARLSTRSVARYRRFAGLFRPLFSNNTRVAAQSAEDAARFVAIGAARERTLVVGNVKFDVSPDAAHAARGLELRAAQWPARPVWIAGSTHAGEEEPVLAAHAELQAAVPGALLLLVPRHPQRFNDVVEMIRSMDCAVLRCSALDGAMGRISDGTVLVLDTLGDLAAVYGLAAVAFVGGSLVAKGGHNPLEPAQFGVPVVMGPSYENFRDIVAKMQAADGIRIVRDKVGLEAALVDLLNDRPAAQAMGERGRKVFEQQQGATARAVEALAGLVRQ